MGSPRGFYVSIISDVLRAIENKDWIRWGKGTNEYYYVFGRAAQGRAGTPTSFLEPPPDDDYGSEFAEWLKNARSGSACPDYLAEILKVSAEFDGDVRTSVDTLVALAPERRKSPSRFRGAFSDVLDAWLQGRTKPEFLLRLLYALEINEQQTAGEFERGSQRQPEWDRGQEVLFLREMVTKVGKAVDRSRGLEPLSFSDPLIEEATRCYLYQFYRATVILCGSAVENQLKARVKDPSALRQTSYYKTLVQYSQLSIEQRAHARGVFEARNSVVHGDQDPGYVLADQVLVAARLLLTELCPASKTGDSDPG